MSNDWEQLLSSNHEMGVSPGWHHVQIEDVELTETAAAIPMVNVWLTLIQGEHRGATMADRLVLAPTPLPKTVEFLDCFGYEHAGATELKPVMREFVGKVLEARIAVGEPYNGRARPEVRGYRTPYAGPAASGETSWAEVE